MIIEAKYSEHPLFRKGSVLAAVANLIGSIQKGDSVELVALYAATDDIVQLEPLRMAISKVAKRTGARVSTRVTDTGLRIWRIE